MSRCGVHTAHHDDVYQVRAHQFMQTASINRMKTRTHDVISTCEISVREIYYVVLK